MRDFLPILGGWAFNREWAIIGGFTVYTQKQGYHRSDIPENVYIVHYATAASMLVDILKNRYVLKN